MKKVLISQKGVEVEYGITVDTQENLRARGVAPPWMRIGHKFFYRREELEKWLDEQQSKATADES